MAKTVRVHDDTHRALKRLKARTRSASIDEVIRTMFKEATGSPPESLKEDAATAPLTRYTET